LHKEGHNTYLVNIILPILLERLILKALI
jgi:hypothetical protein